LKASLSTPELAQLFFPASLRSTAINYKQTDATKSLSSFFNLKTRVQFLEEEIKLHGSIRMTHFTGILENHAVNQFPNGLCAFLV